MKGRVKLIALIVTATVMIAGSISYGVMRMEKSKGEFAEDGYILGEVVVGEEDEQADINCYFSAGSKYQKKYPGKVQFEQTDGEKATIEQDSYVHFMDDSLMAFSRGVVIDLDALNEKSLSYYNISQEIVIDKQADSYIFHTSSNEQRFQNYLWKVSDDKYMVVSDQLKLHFSEGNDKELEKYVEINFVDKDVVRLVHQDGAYQTVAADAYIDLANGARIRLADRMVAFGEEDKLALGQMVIDSDDNIEIAVKDETEEDDEEDEEDENGEGEGDAQTTVEGGGTNNSSNSTSNTNQTNNAQTVIGAGDNGTGGNGTDGNGTGGNGTGGNGTDGNGTGGNGTDVSDSNEVDTDAEFPTFALSEMEAGMVSLQANIEITDDDDLLGEKGVDIKILENGSNKLIWQKHVEKGVYAIPINIDVLTPDTEYVLIANSDYTYRDENYNKDFVSQMFETNALGVKISKKSVTEDSMTVHVSVDSYSELTSGVMYVTQGADYSTEEGLSFEDIKAQGGTMDVEFDNLNSNTSYDVRVGALYTGSVMLQSDYDIKGQFTTLKRAPTLGVPDVSINKAQSSFTLWLNKVADAGTTTTANAVPIVDPDDGVTKVVFEVYNTGQIKNGEPDSPPLQTIVSDNTASVNAAVDGTVLQRNISYCYRVVVDFYDNEKTVEYVSQISNPFNLDSAEFPSVTFEPKDDEPGSGGIVKKGIEYDSFRGVVTIKDEGNVVLRPNTIHMSITGNDGGDVQLKTWDLAADGEMSTSISVTGLRANTTYTVSLRGMVNLQDGNPDMEAYLGSFQLTTLEKPSTVQANVTAPKTAAEMSRQYAFDVKFQMTDYTDAENNTTDVDYELSTMNSVVLEMYTGVKDESGNLEKGALWGRRTLANTTSYDAAAYRYDSSLKTEYSDNEYVITPETFGMTNSNVTSDSYILVVKDAVDYTDFKNEIDIKKQGGEAAEFVITPHGFVPNLPADINNTINVSSILYGTMQDSAGQSTYPVIAASGSADPALGLKSDTIVGYVAHASGFPSNGLQFAEKVTYHMYKVKSFSGDIPNFNDREEVASKVIDVPEGSGSLPSWEVPVKAGTKVERGNVYFFTYEVDLDLSRGEGTKIPAKYPKDAINGSGVTLRSGEEYCEKERPKMRMYLKNMEQSGSTYSQTYEYQYTDVDGAYTNTPFKIENGTKTLSGGWNQGTGDTKTLNVTGISNAVGTLNIKKETALYNDITNYSGAKSDVLITSQPVDWASNLNFGTIKYKLEPDASRMKIMLDTTPFTNKAELRRIAAVKATVHCEGDEKVFDYLPVDTSYQAYIPLLNMSSFMGKDLTIDVDVYYDNGLMGTEKLESNGNQNKVLLINYNRTAGYSYQGNTGTAGDSIYTIDSSFVSNIFTVDGSTKSFSAAKWKNTSGQEKYSGGNASSKSFALDQQGLSQNTTGSNPDRDNYYVFREIKLQQLSYDGDNNKTRFTYIRPTISNVEIEPGVTDAKVTFTYNGVNKSIVKDGKLYLILNTSEAYGAGAQRYEINLKDHAINANGSGTVTITLGSGSMKALTPGETYYFTVSAMLQADAGQEEELRLLNKNNEEVSETFITLPGVTFTNTKYSYVNKSYADKEMHFAYDVDVVTGYTVNLELTDEEGNPITLGSEYDKVTTLVPQNVTILPVGNSTASDYERIEGWDQLVYGKQYTLTGTAVTAAGQEIGEFTIPFVLRELQPPFFSVTSIASRTDQKDAITFTVVANDTTFAMKNEEYTIRVYKGKDVDAKPVVYERECTLDVSSDGTHQARTMTQFTLGEASTGAEQVKLLPDTDYTLVITTTADKGYGDPDRQTTETKVYTTKTLNDYGIAYGRVFATPDSSGNIKLDFYDTVGFSNVRSMDYSIYADTKESVAPISGTITALQFVGASANQRSISVPAGLEVSDTYTMRINLKNQDGVIVAREEIGFSYSNNRVVNALMQMLQN